MKSIVIGSGFGGIAAALRLKAKNHNVTLIEKHPDLGGRARVFKKNGFTFELSNISYGGQIDCYEIRGSEQYDEGQILEKEIQLIWDSLK